MALGLSIVAGCTSREDYQLYNNGLISPYCIIGSHNAVTKSLINQSTITDTILCNFIRIDNPTEPTDWKEAYVSEGSIATYTQNNTYRRHVSLYPPQPYDELNPNNESRMVGWYPRTVDLPENAHEQTVSTKLSNFTSTMIEATYEDEQYIGIKFTGLNGSTDVMVSDVKDGSFNLPFAPFTFKHHLSAVKVYAKAINSSQDMGMWGKIDKVIIMGQPTSCTVLLPQTESNADNIVLWGDENAKFPITTTPIFGTYDTDNSENISAEKYPIELSCSSIEKYLGYSLIQPGNDLRMQIHTSSGVYEVNIENPFNPGKIYEIHMNFQTDGTIMVYLENEGDERYLDLSRGEEYQADTDGDGDIDGDDSNLFKNKYANCYMVYSDPTGTDQDPEGTATSYDGFCFDATVIGNGETGIISEGAQYMYPTDSNIAPFSADILWETSPRLITQVELIFGFVRFKVAKEDGTFKEGNAIIAVYDENKNILWSWHIWITDKPNEITYREGETSKETSITILDRNVGATFGGIPTNGDQALESYGLYYQWGRKDPSMGPPEWDYTPINMTTAPYYDYSSETFNTANVMRFAHPTLKDAVENPLYILMPTSQTQTYYFNWMYEKMDFLWGYNSTTGMTRKTIYDPCPYGYRVSGGEIADLFAYATSISATTSYDRSDYGQTVKVPIESGSAQKTSIFFPYTGFKGVDRGLNSLVASWKYVGQKGDYQASTVSTYASDEEYFMHRTRIYISKERQWSELNVGSYTGYQIEDHTNRRTAAPVRCVKNEEHSRIMAFVTPDKYTISTSNPVVNLDLYAEAYGTTLQSATLTIGYHMKNDDGSEGDHSEKPILYIPDISTESKWNRTVECNISELLGVDLTKTTGTFRFVLHVKSADNINKISSTSISLSNNHIGFETWNQTDSTVFIGEPISKQVRIYGDSKPTKVEMFKHKPDETEEGPIDITSNLSVVSGSVYAFDYLCSTNGLSFDDKGWNYVYFQVTYESGETVTYNTDKRHKKWFKAVGISLSGPITTASFDTNKSYIIKNSSNSTGGYLFDNGSSMNTNTVDGYDYSHMFRIIRSGSGYKIYNISTSDYVTQSRNGSRRTLNITQKAESSATVFTIESPNNNNNNNNGFLIYNSNYYWYRNNNIVTISNSDSGDTRRWLIYEVTEDTSGIPEFTW